MDPKPPGSEGTDHGTGTVVILAGGALKGGRVIADWPGVKESQLFENRDLKPTTDLPAVRADELGELVAAILAEFRDRVLPIDIDTARHIARLAEKTYRQPIPLADLIVAATAVRHGLTLLTRNMDEMGRLRIGARNPFAKLPPDA